MILRASIYKNCPERGISPTSAPPIGVWTRRQRSFFRHLSRAIAEALTGHFRIAAPRAWMVVEVFSVRRIQISVLAITIVLASCTVELNSRRGGNDPTVWGRIDCQRGEGNPELQKQFNDAEAICLTRGETEDVVAGNTGGSPCMTEQGYVLRTRAQHEAACQGVEQQSRPTMKKQVSRQNPVPAQLPAAPD